MILVKNAATRSSPFAAFSNITQYFHLCKYFLRQQRLVDIAPADAAVLCHQLHRFLPADPLLLINFHMLLERQVLPVPLLFLLQFLKCLSGDYQDILSAGFIVFIILKNLLKQEYLWNNLYYHPTYKDQKIFVRNGALNILQDKRLCYT